MSPALAPAAKKSQPVPSNGWTLQATGEVKWSKITYAGTYLYATDAGLYSVDPETGKPLWSRDDLKKVLEFSVEEIAGSPALFVADNTGKINVQTRLLAIDILTGENIWTTDRVKGSIVDLVADYRHDAVVLFTVPMPAAKSKLDILALEMPTGKVIFESSLDDKADLYINEKSGKFMPRHDLNGHAEPVFDEDAMYVAYAGLHKFDIKTGNLLWKSAFDVTEKDFKNTNASPVIGKDMVYSSAKGVIRGFDKATGQLKFTTADFGAGVPEMVLNNGTLYGRMGGVFFEPTKREYHVKKPFGVVAVDGASGEVRWRFDGAKDAITNMHIDPAANVLLIADAKHLIGLSLDASGNKVKEAYKIQLEWKNRSSTGGKIAKNAGKFALGGVRGLAKSSPSEQDTPLAIVPRANGTLVVRGKQNLLAFDPKNRTIAWGSAFKAPGLSNFNKIMTTAAFAMAYAESTHRAATSYRGTMENDWANRDRQRAMQQYSKAMSKRYSASTATGQYAYMLTDVDTADGKGPGIVGVNLDSGEADRELYFKDREPEYVVDEQTGMVVRHHKGGGDIIGAPVK